jgi:hypothetical protein
MYRPGGIYYLENERSMVIPTDVETPVESIIQMVKYFEGKL